MRDQRVDVFLCLGCNLGDREGYIEQALGRLSGNPLIEVVEQSSLFESEPRDFTDQPWFLNCVVGLKTTLEPNDLLKICQSIENKLGRKRGIRYGPRVIDLDILSYGQQVIKTPSLQVPHPRLQERRFALEPLCEINPDWEHPILRKSAKTLLEEIGDKQKVRYFKKLSEE